MKSTNSRSGPRIHNDTELALLRGRADLTIPEAAEEAALFLGNCSVDRYSDIEADPGRVPPALLARFKVLAARRERQLKRQAAAS